MARQLLWKPGLDETVETLTQRAQIALGVGKGRLLDSFGVVLDGYVSNIQNGDSLTLHVRGVEIQSTSCSFAAILGDGSVVTWGLADCGGDSTAVQDQLKNVQQIQAASIAFAAILGDGSVVAWGRAEFGGDTVLRRVSCKASSRSKPLILRLLHSWRWISGDLG